jgi:hypothetical protein
MDDFKSLLKKAKENWKESKITVKNMIDKIPEGEYTVKLLQCQLAIAKTGALMVKRSHIITDENLKGFQIFDNIVLTTDFGMAHLRKYFEMLGIDCPEDPEDIDDIIKEICKKGYTAKVIVSHQKDSDFIRLKIEEIIENESSKDNDDEEDDSKTKPNHGNAEEEEEEIDLDSMDRTALKELIKEQKLNVIVKKSMSDDDIRKAISDVVNESESESESENATEESNPLLDSAKEFCTSHDLEYDEDIDLDSIKKIIKSETYKEKKLDKSEISLLKELGLSKNIK